MGIFGIDLNIDYSSRKLDKLLKETKSNSSADLKINSIESDLNSVDSSNGDDESSSVEIMDFSSEIEVEFNIDEYKSHLKLVGFTDKEIERIMSGDITPEKLLDEIQNSPDNTRQKQMMELSYLQSCGLDFTTMDELSTIINENKVKLEKLINKKNELNNNHIENTKDLDEQIKELQAKQANYEYIYDYINTEVNYYFENIEKYTTKTDFLSNNYYNSNCMDALNTIKENCANQPIINNIHIDDVKKARINEKEELIDVLSCMINGMGDISEGYIKVNNITYKLESSDIMLEHMVKWLPFISETEKEIFNYKYNTEGKDAAYNYLEAISEELDNRWLANETKNDQKFAEDHPFLASIASIVVTPVEGMSAIAYSLNSYLTNEKIRRTDVYSSGDVWRGQVSQIIALEHGEGWAFVYNTGMSMADTGSLILLNMATGGTASVVLSASLMGSRAYVSTLNDALDRGISDGKAILLAASAGIVETAMESASLGHLVKLEEKLGKNVINKVGQIANSIENEAVSKIVTKSFYIGASALSQGLCEGEEEFWTEIANYVIDIFVSKDLSNYSKTIENYLNNGYSEEEALFKTMIDFSGQAFQAFLGGFVSGLCFGSFGGVTSTNRTSYAIANDMYNELGGDTFAKKFAEALKINQDQIANYEQAVKAIKNKEQLTDEQLDLLFNGTTEMQAKAKIKEARREQINKINNEIQNISQGILNASTAMSMLSLRKTVLGTFGSIPATFNKTRTENLSTNIPLLEKCSKEGLVHITSEASAEKILESGYVKASGNVITSYGTTPKAFFFSGIPDFGAVCMNSDYKEKMIGVRIKPTIDSLSDSTFKYRSHDDFAITHDGNYVFDKALAELVYLVLDINEDGEFYYRETTKNEYENYVPNINSISRNAPEIIKKLGDAIKGYSFGVSYQYDILANKVNSINKLNGSKIEEISSKISGLSKQIESNENLEKINNVDIEFKTGKDIAKYFGDSNLYLLEVFLEKYRNKEINIPYQKIKEIKNGLYNNKTAIISEVKEYLTQEELNEYNEILNNKGESLQTKWLDKLSDIEKFSLSGYGKNFGSIPSQDAFDEYGYVSPNRSSFVTINELLRAGYNVDTTSIDSALEKFGILPNEITTYRGVSIDALTSEFGNINPEDLSSLIGQTYHDKGYMSTSLLEAKAISTGDSPTDVIMKIKIPNDANYGAYIESQTDVDYNQLEFLIKKGSKAIIENAYKNESGKIVLEMKLFEDMTSVQNISDTISKIDDKLEELESQTIEKYSKIENKKIIEFLEDLDQLKEEVKFIYGRTDEELQHFEVFRTKIIEYGSVENILNNLDTFTEWEMDRLLNIDSPILVELFNSQNIIDYIRKNMSKEDILNYSGLFSNHSLITSTFLSLTTEEINDLGSLTIFNEFNKFSFDIQKQFIDLHTDFFEKEKDSIFYKSLSKDAFLAIFDKVGSYEFLKSKMWSIRRLSSEIQIELYDKYKSTIYNGTQEDFIGFAGKLNDGNYQTDFIKNSPFYSEIINSTKFETLFSEIKSKEFALELIKDSDARIKIENSSDAFKNIVSLLTVEEQYKFKEIAKEKILNINNTSDSLLMIHGPNKVYSYISGFNEVIQKELLNDLDIIDSMPIKTMIKLNENFKDVYLEQMKNMINGSFNAESAKLLFEPSIFKLMDQDTINRAALALKCNEYDKLTKLGNAEAINAVIDKIITNNFNEISTYYSGYLIPLYEATDEIGKQKIANNIPFSTLISTISSYKGEQFTDILVNRFNSSDAPTEIKITDLRKISQFKPDSYKKIVPYLSNKQKLITFNYDTVTKLGLTEEFVDIFRENPSLINYMDTYNNKGPLNFLKLLSINDDTEMFYDNITLKTLFDVGISPEFNIMNLEKVKNILKDGLSSYNFMYFNEFSGLARILDNYSVQEQLEILNTMEVESKYFLLLKGNIKNKETKFEMIKMMMNDSEFRTSISDDNIQYFKGFFDSLEIEYVNYILNNANNDFLGFMLTIVKRNDLNLKFKEMINENSLILNEFEYGDAELIYGNLSNENKTLLDNKINSLISNIGNKKVDFLFEEATTAQKSAFLDAYNKGLITDEKLDLLTKIKSKNKFVLSTFNYSLFDDDIYQFGENLLTKLSKYHDVVDQIVELKNNPEKFNLFTNFIINDKTDSTIVADQKMAMLLNYLLENDIDSVLLSVSNLTELEIARNIILKQIDQFSILDGTMKEIIRDRSIIVPDSYTLDNYDLKLAEKCDELLQQATNVEEVQNLIFNKYFSISIEDATELFRMYGSRFSKIKNLDNDGIATIYLENMQNILNMTSMEEAIDYYNSFESINRYNMDETLDIINSIKKIYTKSLKDTLFNPTQITGYVTYEGKQIPIYEPQGDFQMLIQSTYTNYGGMPMINNNYFDSWNLSSRTANHGICCSLISNNNMGMAMVKGPGVVIGFNGFSDEQMNMMAPYDIYTRNDGYVIKCQRPLLYLPGQDVVNETRHTHNEFNLERTNLTGEGNLANIQPDYVVVFEEMSDELKQNAYKASIEFNVPLVYINKNKLAATESTKIDNLISEYNQTGNIQLLKDILVLHENNRSGYRNPTDSELVTKYFPKERIQNVLEQAINNCTINNDVENLEKIKEFIQEELRKFDTTLEATHRANEIDIDAKVLIELIDKRQKVLKDLEINTNIDINDPDASAKIISVGSLLSLVTDQNQFTNFELNDFDFSRFSKEEYYIGILQLVYAIKKNNYDLGFNEEETKRLNYLYEKALEILPNNKIEYNEHLPDNIKLRLMFENNKIYNEEDLFILYDYYFEKYNPEILYNNPKLIFSKEFKFYLNTLANYVPNSALMYNENKEFVEKILNISYNDIIDIIILDEIDVGEENFNEIISKIKKWTPLEKEYVDYYSSKYNINVENIKYDENLPNSIKTKINKQKKEKINFEEIEKYGVIDIYLPLSKYINEFINKNYPLTKEDYQAIANDKSTSNLERRTKISEILEKSLHSITINEINSNKAFLESLEKGIYVKPENQEQINIKISNYIQKMLKDLWIIQTINETLGEVDDITIDNIINLEEGPNVIEINGEKYYKNDILQYLKNINYLNGKINNLELTKKRLNEYTKNLKEKYFLTDSMAIEIINSLLNDEYEIKEIMKKLNFKRFEDYKMFYKNFTMQGFSELENYQEIIEQLQEIKSTIPSTVEIKQIIEKLQTNNIDNNLYYLNTCSLELKEKLLKDKNFKNMIFKQILLAPNAWFSFRDSSNNINNVMEISEICNLLIGENLNEITPQEERNLYILYATMFEKNSDETWQNVMKNNYLFENVVNLSKNIVSVVKINDYQLLLDVINKINDLNIPFNNYIHLSNIEHQRKLLTEPFDDNLIIKLVNSSDMTVMKEFFLNDISAIKLWPKFNIIDLARKGIVFNRKIIETPEFFNKLKSSNLIQFRNNIEIIQKNNPSLYIEEHISKYYDQLLKTYDKRSEMFKQYSNLETNNEIELDAFLYDKEVQLLQRNNDISGLKQITNLKISEIIVDALFGDNIYNVSVNIKEMLRYNERLSVNERILDKNTIDLYNAILNIDKISPADKIKLYNILKNKNIGYNFYLNIRKLKNLSYQFIKEDMLKLEQHDELIDEKLSTDLGVKIYDFRGKNYVALIRGNHIPYYEITNNKMECFTLLSNENTARLQRDYIYGYSNFSNENIVNMNETDVFSIDSKDVTEAVFAPNRIATSRQLIMSNNGLSEINIATENIGNNRYKSIRPDYLFCVDEINQKHIAEAKRLNIPIVITTENILEKGTNELGGTQFYGHNNIQNYIYYNNYSSKALSDKLKYRLNNQKEYTEEEIQNLYKIVTNLN